MSKKKHKKKDTEVQNDLAHMSWGLILFLWFCWWPLGVGFTIGKLAAQKRERDEREQAARRSGYGSGGQYADLYGYGEQAPYSRAPGPGEYGYRPGAAQRDPSGSAAGQGGGAARYSASEPPPSQQQAKAAARRKWLVPAMLILGAAFASAGAGLLAEGIDFLAWQGQLWDRWTFTEYLLPGLLELAGGVGLFFSGLRTRSNMKKEQMLDTIVGPRDCVSLKELGAAVGLNQKQTVKVVQSAIEHGMFGADAYIDMIGKQLVVRGDPPQPAPKPQKKEKPAPAKAAEEDPYQAILRQLREVNDAIPGEEMSAKISRMEQISARIFELAKQDPQKKPQLQRFMDYYLPTSLKLLNTYATLDRQGVDGENITETKRNIENAMDLLVTAFENQLDKLYESDALDVSSDIAALQGMLNLDGLTGQKDFDTPPRNGPAQEPPV